MATVISKVKAIDFQSLEEAMQQPDLLKWEVAIKTELNALKKAGTWKIVE
jgi:hypothetical protein